MAYKVVIYSDTPRSRVVVEGNVAVSDFTFGPFEKSEEAEKCVIALSSRDDVTSAKIEEIV